MSLEITTGKSYGGTNYSTNLAYLIVKNQNLSFDTIFPVDIKFFLRSGITTRYLDPLEMIFKDGYFISFQDTSLKTNPKCKFCKINIDSVEKIAVRGRRLNKKK